MRPQVSPDGSRMVYSTWRNTGKHSYDIETAKPGGSDRCRLTEDSGYIDVAPAWSSDDSRIAFARVAHPYQRAYTGAEKSGIYIMAADGSGLRRVYRLRGSLPEDPASEQFQSGPVWSPDGETLAFSIHQRMSVDIGKEREVLHAGVLYTMRADGSNLAAVYDGKIESGARVNSPAWSPDGGRLAFDYDFTYTVNSDGTGLRKAADVDSGRGVSWSPDGTKLLLVSWAGEGTIVYIAEADGGGDRHLGDVFCKSRRAAWSPGGSRIAIIKEHDSDTPPPPPYLQTMAADGSDVQVLVERHEEGKLRAANSADGWRWPWQW